VTNGSIEDFAKTSWKPRMTDPLLPHLQHLAEAYTGTTLAPAVSLRGDGSDRKIYRFTHEGQSWVGVTNPATDENAAFLEMSRHFRGKGLPVPEIYAEDRPHDCYLLEDLGDVTLADQLLAWDPAVADEARHIRAAYRPVIEILPTLQFAGVQGFQRAWCHAAPESTTALFRADLRYFEENFWQVFAAEKARSPAVLRELDNLAEAVGEIPRNVFVSRDFQARNLMPHRGTVYLIDYQSGGVGALHYDLASLLYASKARLNDPLRQQLIADYLDAARGWFQADEEAFTSELFQFVLLRRLRSLGTYGFLPRVKGKLHFLDAIPATLREVHQLLHTQPALRPWQDLRGLFDRWHERAHLHDAGWLRQQVTLSHTHPSNS
jgi:aminoglycoside/choline kinase family phosphotransferase